MREDTCGGRTPNRQPTQFGGQVDIVSFALVFSESSGEQLNGTFEKRGVEDIRMPRSSRRNLADSFRGTNPYAIQRATVTSYIDARGFQARIKCLAGQFCGASSYTLGSIQAVPMRQVRIDEGRSSVKRPGRLGRLHRL